MTQSNSKLNSAFLNRISHDIRTPMNSINGFIAMAKKYAHDGDKVIDYLNKIDVSVNQLFDLISQVMEMSEIGTGKIGLDMVPVNISDKFSSQVSVLEEQAQELGLQFHHSLDINHNYVMADDNRMSQITFNVVGNAMKYTPKGGRVYLHIGENPCNRPGMANYTFTVTDTGIGMSREFMETMFEPFTREDNATVNKIHGAGLGLTIVRSLVDMMGGEINVESHPGEGTKFEFSLDLPIDTDAEHDLEISRSVQEATIESLKGHRVLLVEDNELNREIARLILEEHGIITEEADDGDVAVEMVRKVTEQGMYDYYSFILMDIQMPRMDGLEATAQIRSIPTPPGVHIPIIAMTANAFAEDRQQVIAAGMDEHIAKPIDVDNLWTTLARFI